MHDERAGFLSCAVLIVTYGLTWNLKSSCKTRSSTYSRWRTRFSVHVNPLKPSLGHLLYNAVVWHEELIHFPGQYFSVSQRKKRTHPESYPVDTWHDPCHLSCSSFCDIRSISTHVYHPNWTNVEIVTIVFNTHKHHYNNLLFAVTTSSCGNLLVWW